MALPEVRALAACQADVIEGKITLTAPFSSLFVCKRIPGAWWDERRKAWTFPATASHANLIATAFPRVVPSNAFVALVEHQAAESAHVAEEPATAEPSVALPSGLKTRPWQHQIDAYSFALDRLVHGNRAALLALEMGAGKTLVALMLLAGTSARRVLISCPLRVIGVWETQIERHLDLPVVMASLGDSCASVARKTELATEKLRLAEVSGRTFIGIINHDSIWRAPFSEWACRQSWDLVIADESHRLKKPGGKASMYFKRLRRRAKHRLALTGTPMPHSPLDVYAQFRFLDPAVFGPAFSAFRQRYAVMGGFQNKEIVRFQHLDDLEARMNTCTFRVSKDVLDLPPENHVTYECSLSTEAQRIYRDLEEDFVARVLDGTVTAANAMVKLLRLQQVTGGWVKTDAGEMQRVDHAKQKLLQDTLDDIGPNEPVVVFCRFHADLDAVHQAASELGYSSHELSGRKDQLKRWQDGAAQVLAVQIGAGGIGVDLTRARYSVYYSLTFSLGEYDQALSRVHRPGQTRPVEHIHLVARGTVDQKIMRALEARAEVIQAVLAEIKGSRR